MNKLKNDNGDWVIAVGSEGSIERAACQYPNLIDEINRLYASAYHCYGKACDVAIEMIRSRGITSQLETSAILNSSLYGNEKNGSVTRLVIGNGETVSQHPTTSEPNEQE